MERVGRRERQYVEEVLATGFRSSAGHAMATRFERAFADAVGASFAIAFVNGTATMHAVLAAAGIGPGDEVVVPPLTMSSTAFAVLHAGAAPIFADVDPETFTLDPASVADRCTDRTRAVIPVALYGVPPDLDGLQRVASDRGLFVLEDDAQAFGARYRDRHVGAIGDAGSFSFQSSKHLASGEGGVVVTDDADLADEVRRFASLGYRGIGRNQGQIRREDIQDPAYLRHASVGFNYRMPELCAAVALAQTERMEELVDARVAAGDALRAAIGSASWLRLQQVPAEGAATWWTVAAVLDDAGPSWHEFRDVFRSEGGDPIYAAWQLSYLEPALRGRTFGDHQSQTFDAPLCPVAEHLQPRLIQFKTNYFDGAELQGQLEAVHRTIDRLDRG